MAFTPDVMVPMGTTFGNLKIVMGVLDCTDGSANAIPITGVGNLQNYALTLKSGSTFETNVFTKSGNELTPVAGGVGDTYYLIGFGI